MGTTTHRLSFFALVLILTGCLVSTAVAQGTAPAVQRLQQFAQRYEQQTHFRDGLLHLAIKPRSNNRRLRREIKHAYLEACGDNVIEFFKVRRRGNLHHLLTRVGHQTVDRGREPALKLSDWYVASGRTDRLGVLVQLRPSELGRLQNYISLASSESTAPSTIGTFSVVGGDYPRSTNCTTWVAKATIGDQHETVGQLCQIGDGQITANRWIASLIQSRGARVLGAVLHNPQEAAFNAQVSFAPFLD